MNGSRYTFQDSICDGGWHRYVPHNDFFDEDGIIKGEQAMLAVQHATCSTPHATNNRKR